MVLWSILGAFWLAALGAGMAAMLRYEFAPGGDEGAPKLWPAASALPRAAGKPTLVVFAHPRCPCTEATVHELTEAVARTRSGAAVLVSFFAPPDAGDEWVQTPTWRSAAAIPGAVVLKDEAGREAARFHASTSGRTLLYNENGELLFDGGITGARGHVGENAGQDSLISLLSHHAANATTTPVFGCRINSLCQK